jgi:putative aminopeptidase FrvX
VEDSSLAFLKRLLDTPGPSGFEAAAARVWREEAQQFAHHVRADVSGNSIAVINQSARPRIMLAGHIDEIGVMITHIDDDGFVYFEGVGGWDSQVLVGQRIRLLTRVGDVVGVIGKKPIHLMKGDDKDKVSKIEDLWIDLGAKDRAAALAAGVRVGDAGVIDARLVELGDGLIASRSIDNRIGAFIVLEALRILADTGAAPMVAAVATAQEEIGYFGGGARTSAYALEPDLAIVVDVTFASDAPGIEKKEVGEHRLGSGPVITRGSAAHPVMVDRLIAAAEASDIPYTLTAAPRYTATDADAIYLSRAGVATAVISVPNRYMHSPNELVALSDLDAAARLIATFCQSVSESDNWLPE